MSAGPGDRVAALRVEGWFRGALIASAPFDIGPVNIHETDRDGRRTRFEIAPQPVDLAWEDDVGVDAAVERLLQRLKRTLVATWRAGIEIITWTHVDALVGGRWYGRAAGLTATGTVSADVVHSIPSADPVAVWEAADRMDDRHTELLNLACLAALRIPDGHVVGVPPVATLIEAHLPADAKLAQGDDLADTLRAVGWPVPQNPARTLPRIRSAVAHPTPRDPLPTTDEFTWTQHVATAAGLNAAGVPPATPAQRAWGPSGRIRHNAGLRQRDGHRQSVGPAAPGSDAYPASTAAPRSP
jgi:hypothetical protein